jgi:hypothetical protein
LKPTRQHLLGAVASGTVILALLIAGFASHTLHISGAASKTAIDVTFGKQQAVTHARGDPGAPFLGPFKVGRCGPAVRLMEGALRHLRHPVRTSKPQACFGPATRKQLIVFQKRIHARPNGVYNYTTHRQLVLRGGYSKTAKRALVYIYDQRVRKQHQVLVVHQRKAVQIIAAHAVKVGGNSLPYTQGPSRSNLPPWPRIPPATDCSGFATWVLYQAGAGGPIGYFGPGSSVGWTGTLRTQGVHISNTRQPNLQPGDLVFYGYPPNWGHVAVYIGGGLVVSHGGPGVNIYRYDYRSPGEVRRYIF